MVAVVAGKGLGVLETSAARLGGAGIVGDAGMGRGNDRVYVNAANGNLVIDRTDEILTGVGADEAYSLTYNSEDGSTFAGTPMAWNLGSHRRIVDITGTVNTAGSTATRIARDGSSTLFTWDATKNCYTSSDGSGPTDELRFATGVWTWTDGASRATEQYSMTSGTFVLKSVADADGNTQTYGYDGNGNLTQITEANGDYCSIVWSGGRPTDIVTHYTNASGLQTLTRVHYVWDNLYRLVSAKVDLTPADGSIADGKVYTTTYGYDGTSLRVTSIGQSDGSHLDIGYTQSGTSWYVTSLTETVASGVNRVTGLYYDLANRATAVTDPLGGVTTMRYDAAGNLTQLVRPSPAPGAAAPTTSFTYNLTGDVTFVTENGHTTAYEYDDRGNRTLIRDAAGDTVTRTYGTKNELLTETHWLVADPDGAGAGAPQQPATTRYAYDAENHLRFIVSAEGDVTEFQYNAAGQATTTIGYPTSKYNLAGLAPTDTLSEATLQGWAAGTDRTAWQRTDTAYDWRGNVQSVTRYSAVDSSGTGIAAGSSQDVYVYDSAGLLLSRTNSASPNVESFAYDGLGRLICATDMANATTTTDFNDAASTTTVTSASGLTTVSVYDKAGELISVTQSGSGVPSATTTEAYDGLGRIRVETDATQRSTYHVYDAASRKVADIGADGAVVEYSYDSGDHLVKSIQYVNRLSASQMTLLGTVSAGGSGGVGAGGVSGPAGPNLLTNGSFDDSGSYTNLSTGRADTTLPGWSKSNPQPFEQVASGQMGITASDGLYWLDLDSIDVGGLVAAGSNLVANGSFEQSGTYTPLATGRSNDTLPGWSRVNAAPFEQVLSGQFGVNSSEGAYWLDLDSIGRTPVGPNLLVNGSFDQSGTYTSIDGGRAATTIPGWTKTNPQPFEQMTWTEAGVMPSDGNFWLDLDSAAGVYATGNNLIVNGSFEQSATSYTTTSWGRYNDPSLDIPGWTKANAQGYEQVASPFNGTAATDGTYFLDMDATGGQDSDMDISQTINGVAPGTQLLLQFDYANTAGTVPGVEGPEASGALWVYWNDQIVATIESPTTDMITKTLMVTASSGQNVLRFREVGPQDGHGSYLDNVQLHQAATTSAGGNMDISQTVKNIARGQVLQLQFDHANRGTTGGFDVLWNGGVIATIADSGNDMTTETLYVVASGGNNTIEFRGLGDVDDVGSSIDNVALYATQQVLRTAVGANVLVNGSFDQSGPYTTIDGGRAATSLPGWTKSNPQPFEQMTWGEDSIAPSDGVFWLDLDSAGGTFATGNNLVTNGSFEQSSASYTTTTNGRYNDAGQNIPGWTKANDLGFKQFNSGVDGTGATDGSFYLGMEASGSGNLLANALILNDTTGWSVTNAARVAGADGEPLAYYFQQSNPSTGGTSQSAMAAVPQGTLFDFSYQVEPGFAGQQFQTAIYWFDASGTFISQNIWDRFPGDTTSFATFSAQVSPPANAVSYYVYTTAVAGGVGKWGGYKLERSTNLIANPLLLSNSSGWSTTNASRVAGAAGDPLAFYFQQTSSGSNGTSQTAMAPVPQGTSFNLTYQVKPSVPGQQFQTAIYWFDASGNFITQSLWDHFPTDTANFTTFSEDITRPANAVSYYLYTTAVAGGTGKWGGYKLTALGSDMDISQTINSAGRGTPLLLQFDYANTAGSVPGVEGPEASGALWVYWNDQVIATIEAPTTAMTTMSYMVTTVQGQNTLRFREVGPQDGHGVALDNVQLHTVATTSGGGNMDVSQTVHGLNRGQVMQLQFDHANRGTTGGFDVVWNGTVIATIDDASTPFMTTETFFVTASGGNNTIEFRGHGDVDDVGSSIDNVRLFATQGAPSGGNMDIKQSFTNLSAGGTYQLLFDHANRTTATSGSFEVWWNGARVATIADTGTAMQTNSYYVTAAGGTNTLEFKGTGNEDADGASLDNVRLFATQAAPSGGNMDISQTVHNLAGGQPYQLQFDHANRTTAASGSFEVWWNGARVATINSTNTVMQTESYVLTALAGDNILEFKGTGTTDSLGASLDKVSLTALQGGQPAGQTPSDPLANLRPTASDSGDLWTWYGYDDAERLVQTLDSTRRAASFAYDGDSRQVGSTAYARLADASVVDALKANPAAPIVLPAADPADRRIRSFYDNDGQLVGTLDGTGGLSQIFYDAAGQKIREVAYAGRPDPSLWSAGTFAQLLASAGTGGADRQADYAYDDRGLLRYSIDTGTADNGSTVGFVTERIYDAADRVIRTVSYATAVTPPAAGTAWSTGYIQPRLAADPANDRTARSTYDAAGRLAFSIDAEGGTVSYGYDAAGNVNKVTAFAAAFTTAGDQNLSVMQNWASANPSAANRVTRSLFDAGGRLVYAVDGEGYVSQYRYDAAGRTSSVTRYDAAYSIVDTDTVASVAALIPAGAAGVTTSYAYDSAGRQSDVTAGNVTTHVDYDGHGQITDVWEAYQAADQSRTHRSYDAAGRLLQEVRAYGTAAAQTVTYEYDGVGNLVHETDQRGSVTTRDYDAAGRVVALTAPLSDGVNAVTHYTYDAFGNVVRMDDARNYSTYYYYDRLDRLTLEVDAEGFGTKTAYTAFGQVASVTRYANRANGTPGIGAPPSFTASVAGALRKDATTQFWYDRAGRVRQEQDAEGGSETYHLDAFGERDRVTGKLGDVVAYTYTNRGLVKDETETITAPGTSTSVVTTFCYDARGNRTKMVEAANETEQRTTLYAYDSLDRLKSVTHDQVAVTDSATLATQPWKPVETTDYDNRGNVVRTVDAAGGTSVFYYDAADRKIAAVDPAGTLATWSYDAANGRVTARVYATAVAAGPNPYGPAPTGSGGYRETISDYDRAGRLTKVTVTGAAVGQDANGVYAANASTSFYSSTVYDAAGNIVRQIDARGNSLWCWYDKAGRKVAEVDQENYLTAYEVDAEGNVTRETRYANPVTAAFSQASDPAALTPAASPDDRITDFEYDRNGRRIRETRRNVESYTVDGTGHLSGPNVGDATILYTYNALGEVLTKQEAAEAAGNTTNYTYDSAGRLIAVSGPAFADYNGQQVRRTIVNQYDGLGDLTSSTVNGARTTSYSYGVGGRLLSMTDAAQFTRSYGYDKAGRAVSEQWTRTLSDGVTTVTEANVTAYDAAGRVVSQGVRTLSGGAWSAGDLTQFRYNAFGDVAAKGMHDLWQETFDYDGAGRLWRSTSGDGTTKYFLADAGGNTTLTVTASGAATSGTISDVAGLIAYLTNNGANAIGAAPVAGLVATIATYDRRGQATGTREPLRELGQGQVATLTNGRTYNAFGEVKSETDARSNTTNFAYNTMGRMVLKTDPAVSVTDEHGVATTGVTPIEHSYFDVSGRLIATRDANGNLTTRALLAGTGYGGTDAMATAEFHADGGVFRTAYDVFGDSRTLTDELQHAETRTYDAMDRVSSVTHRGGLLTDNYVYDGLGQRTGHWNSFYGAGVVERTDYDSQGRVTSQSDLSGLTTSYSYAWQQGAQTAGLGTFGGWLKTTTAPGAPYQATETDDYFGRVVARQDLGGHTYNFTYNNAGQLVTRTNSAGEYLSFSYYNGGQVAGQSGTQGDAAYAYDIAGNLVAETFSLNGIARRNATASYDALNRMTAWQDQGYLNTAPASSAWTYDANGNIRSVSATHVSLDNAGNVTGSSSQTSWYAYDKMNRVTVSEGILDPDTGTVSRGTTGRLISYDLAGERKSVLYTASLIGVHWEYFGGAAGSTGNFDTQPIVGDGSGTDGHWETRTFHFQGDRREDYSYNADGTLAATTKADAFMDAGPEPSASEQTWPDPVYIAPPTVGNPLATYTRDAIGRVTHYFEQGGFDGSYERSNIQYDAAGRELSETNTTMRRDAATDISLQTYKTYLTNSYTSGLLTGQYQNNWKGSSDTDAADSRLTYGYQWWDGAQQQTIGNDNDDNGTVDWTTTYSYDPSGRAGSVYIADGKPRGVSLATDQNGMIIDRTEAAQGGSPRTLRYVFGGVQMGEVGNNGTDNMSFAASVADRLVIQPTPTAAGPFHNGATSGTQFADFDQSYDAINSASDAGAGSTYVVASGDTLQSIAALVWGDASLWYLIADANGMSGAEQLQAGRSLAIPDVVANVHNNATTFRPYDPTRAIGDVNPSTPKPVKNHHGCGVMGTILLVAIAVAVTVITGGAATAVATGVSLGSGIGAFVAGTAALSAGELIAIGAGAAAVGSAVSQGVGIATGLQQKFDWKGLAISAISGGVSAGLGQMSALAGGKGLTAVLQGAARGAIGSAVTQGISVAVGLQKSFDFVGVAAAGVSGGVAAAVGKAVGLKSLALDRSIENQLRGAFSGMAASIANAATRSVIDGSDFGDNLMAGLPDVIGETIGNMLALGVAGPDPKREPFGGGKTQQRHDIVAASVAGIQDIVPSADLSDYRAAADNLVDNPNDPQARQRLERATRELLLNNRGNPAVEELADTLGIDLSSHVVGPGDIEVNGNKDYLVGRIVDNSGVWLGEEKQKIGAAVGQFIEEHPAAGLAMRIADTAMAGLAPARYLGGKVVSYFKDSLADWMTSKMEGPRSWNHDKAVSGGQGFVFAGTVILTGLSAFAAKGFGRTAAPPPSFKTFSALKAYLGSPGKGNEWHHIVEQSKVSQFGAEAIHTPSNVVAIPADVHRKISGFYSSKQSFTAGMTVRDWLKGRSFQEQFEFGMQQIKRLSK